MEKGDYEVINAPKRHPKFSRDRKEEWKEGNKGELLGFIERESDAGFQMLLGFSSIFLQFENESRSSLFFWNKKSPF